MSSGYLRRHRNCSTCGYQWYGHPEDPCSWCEATRQFPQIPTVHEALGCNRVQEEES